MAKKTFRRQGTTPFSMCCLLEDAESINRNTLCRRSMAGAYGSSTRANTLFIIGIGVWQADWISCGHAACRDHQLFDQPGNGNICTDWKGSASRFNWKANVSLGHSYVYLFALTTNSVRAPGWRCKAKVNFDTMVDKSFFALQKVRDTESTVPNRLMNVYAGPWDTFEDPSRIQFFGPDPSRIWERRFLRQLHRYIICVQARVIVWYNAPDYIQTPSVDRGSCPRARNIP